MLPYSKSFLARLSVAGNNQVMFALLKLLKNEGLPGWANPTRFELIHVFDHPDSNVKRPFFPLDRAHTTTVLRLTSYCSEADASSDAISHRKPFQTGDILTMSSRLRSCFSGGFRSTSAFSASRDPLKFPAATFPTGLFEFSVVEILDKSNSLAKSCVHFRALAIFRQRLL